VPVTGRFLEGTTVDDLFQGCAILGIADRGTGAEAFYWAEAVTSGGRLVGVRLAKWGSVWADRPRHYVHLDGVPSCDCQDATYRPGRPGGCRHVRALADALAGLVAGRKEVA
jgi:hypothetical protein